MNCKNLTEDNKERIRIMLSCVINYYSDKYNLGLAPLPIKLMTLKYMQQYCFELAFLSSKDLSFRDKHTLALSFVQNLIIFNLKKGD